MGITRGYPKFLSTALFWDSSVTNSGCWLDGVGCHNVGFSCFTTV